MDDTFAVGPDGSIYPCYRFVGMPEWVMGTGSSRNSRSQRTSSFTVSIVILGDLSSEDQQ
jgi:uncharacterized protein